MFFAFKKNKSFHSRLTFQFARERPLRQDLDWRPPLAPSPEGGGGHVKEEDPHAKWEQGDVRNQGGQLRTMVLRAGRRVRARSQYEVWRSQFFLLICTQSTSPKITLKSKRRGIVLSELSQYFCPEKFSGWSSAPFRWRPRNLVLLLLGDWTTPRTEEEVETRRRRRIP